ncbi:hypothetical protein [Saccharothrix yanglingensis]|uniref:Peptidase inhibitor family I36 n=1 Tax=Saccharothrix yanglingensis TaxID=659496 RepID=A0ABU0X757_9PSEU|nr:hypothetical protein [Saccharothrix yanglingensis]MDQ2587970.1 hypothetical protein [Saccharothrix yanglingensis]
MRLKTILLAVAAAGLLVTAPATSAAASTSDEAWPPGNCQRGTFCVWPNWAHPEPAPVETPSLMTDTEWSGSVPAKTFHNYTSRNVDLGYSYTWPDGSTSNYTNCVRPGGNIFYLPVTVTKVRWHEGSC